MSFTDLAKHIHNQRQNSSSRRWLDSKYKLDYVKAKTIPKSQKNARLKSLGINVVQTVNGWRCHTVCAVRREQIFNLNVVRAQRRHCPTNLFGWPGIASTVASLVY